MRVFLREPEDQVSEFVVNVGDVKTAAQRAKQEFIESLKNNLTHVVRVVLPFCVSISAVESRTPINMHTIRQPLCIC